MSARSSAQVLKSKDFKLRLTLRKFETFLHKPCLSNWRKKARASFAASESNFKVNLSNFWDAESTFADGSCGGSCLDKTLKNKKMKFYLNCCNFDKDMNFRYHQIGGVWAAGTCCSDTSCDSRVNNLAVWISAIAISTTGISAIRSNRQTDQCHERKKFSKKTQIIIQY